MILKLSVFWVAGALILLSIQSLDADAGAV